MGTVTYIHPKRTVIVYTRAACGRCERLKHYLVINAIEFTELPIDEHKPDLLAKYPSLKYLPVVEIDDMVIGSLEEATLYFDKEKLEQ